MTSHLPVVMSKYKCMQMTLYSTFMVALLLKWLKSSLRLKHSCLQLNTSKTVAMFFSKTHSSLSDEPDILVSGERLQIVPEYKYLGVILDSNLSFSCHAKLVSNRIKFALSNFRHSCQNVHALNDFFLT